MESKADKYTRTAELLRTLNADTVSYAQLGAFVRTISDKLATVTRDFATKLDIKSLSTRLDTTRTALEAKIAQKADEKRMKAAIDTLRSELRRATDDIRLELPEFEELEAELVTIRRSIPDKYNDKPVWDSLRALSQTLEATKEELKTYRVNTTPRGGMFTPRGFQLLVSGAKKGQVNYVNFVEGSGVTLAYNQANGRNDITISADGGSGALTVLTATGTKDDSNTAFTFVSKPVLIVVNGASYRENAGWTWSAGTLTATLTNPVGTGGDIYALG